jgi:sodium/hydrogen exchanger family protein
MLVALITIAVILILYGGLSRPLDARGITSAMIFTAAGLCVGTSALKLVNIQLESLTAERICELALVFLLFSDATRIDLAGLRRHLGWPSRLLLIGLPLTILAGLGAGLLVFPGYGAGQRLRPVDNGLLDRRGARTACRLRHLRTGPGAPGAGRRKRTQRRPRRAVLPGRCRPAAGPAVGRRHRCRRAQHGRADRLGPGRRPRGRRAGGPAAPRRG